MANYRITACAFCGASFTPTTSRNKHCCFECRFKSICAPFAERQDCWEWPLSIMNNGYGQFFTSTRAGVLAHRLSYELFVGPIGDGLFVCHKCDNRACFNPRHLFLGTPKENAEDMMRKGRYNHDRKRVGNVRSFDPRKLTMEQAAEACASTESARALGRKFGVCHKAIQNARRRFGTTRGSEVKTELLAKSPPVK